MDATTTHSTIQRRVTETIAPSAININSIELTVAADPETGKLIERRLDVDFLHDEDAINAVASALIVRLRVPSAR